jgi:hypothetical protein
LSELGWNAVPPESGIPPVYGQVTLEQQGRYAALAYDRMEREWPWLGVGFYWFFKQADDRERASNPQYYFRMVEPDFTPLPVYQAMQKKTQEPPLLYPGWHQANHWAVTYQGNWQVIKEPEATFGDALRTDEGGATATFTFEGSSLSLAVTPSPGRLRVQIDQEEPIEIDLDNKSVKPELVSSQFSIHDSQFTIINLAHTLPQQAHHVSLEVVAGHVVLDGFIIESRPNLILNWAGSALMVLATVVGAWFLWQQRRRR